jgi:Trypsin-like peptidase domain
LGRVLTGAEGEPVGTCFQVAPGVAVTAWHVLDAVDAGGPGDVVWVDPLAGGAAAAGRVGRVDPVHDLAVVVLGVPLPAGVPGLSLTDAESMSSPVVMTGVAELHDPPHSYRFWDASGSMQGGTTRDEAVPLGRVESSAVMVGMSGTAVRRAGDGFVVGVVSGRYNSADGWGTGSVWVARVEDLLPLLYGLADPMVCGRVHDAGALDLELRVTAQEVHLVGSGVDARAAHRGVSSALTDAVGRLRHPRTRNTLV